MLGSLLLNNKYAGLVLGLEIIAIVNSRTKLNVVIAINAKFPMHIFFQH